QKAQYSPHRHRHVNTFQTLSDDRGNLLWIGDACDGATHDLSAIAESAVAATLAETEVTVIADKGYTGTRARPRLARVFASARRRKDDTRSGSDRVAEGAVTTEI